MSSFDQNPAGDLNRPLPLAEVGLTQAQKEILEAVSSQRQGLMLFSGPRRSGKSQTLYSLLGELDLRERSLVSIENPLEFSLPFGKQKQVNEAAGESVELLFLEVVEEDPEIFFLGEIQNKVGAWASVKFAKKGRLAVATLPSANATTAIFRLESMGVPRRQIGETLSAVVAQRLIERLCPECREVKPISQDEEALLAPFTSDPPETVAHPVGCPNCGGSGFLRKRAVFEVIKIGSELAELIGDGLSISDIRRHARRQGTALLTDGGIQGIRDLDFPVRTVYESLLLEDLDRSMAAGVLAGAGLAHGVAGSIATPQGIAADPKVVGEGPGDRRASILMVEDDSATRVLVERILLDAGYLVSSAEDGAAALFKLATESPDLILSDIHMPNLDGMKLLELVHQHGIKAPVVMLTAEEAKEVEERSYQLGAVDFLRKPVDKAVILESLERALAPRDSMG